jgi:hypothetical protein
VSFACAPEQLQALVYSLRDALKSLERVQKAAQ